MAPETWSNLPAMLFDQAERLGERPFLWAKRDNAYRPISWAETADRTAAIARGLLAMGVSPGERVVLCAENSPDWLMTDVAVMSIGGITVPAYTTNTESDHRHVLADSGACGVVCATRRLLERILPVANQMDGVRFVVCLEGTAGSGDGATELIDADTLLARGAARDDDVAGMARQWRRDSTACVIYTSGTGGAPKGVMLHHGAILHNVAGAEEALRELGLGDEIFLSFLPLSHSYEHTAGQFFPISIGAQIYYAEGVEHLGTNMVEARPTIMTAVPRLYESLYQRITRGVRREGGLKEKLFWRTHALGAKRYHDPASLSLLERMQDRLLDRLVREKVRGRFGGQLKALVSGGAPLNPDIGLFFTALGLRILQGYGQSESGPVMSVNRVHNTKLHTVGPPLKDTEVRIAGDGEILCRGELVMQGYWNDDESTQAVLQDGWLHTGDVGTFDEDGHLMITDRKKDIIVNSGGDNVSPQRVEAQLCLEPEIQQAMVYGDRHPHLVALLVLDETWLAEWAAAHGKDADPVLLRDDEELTRDIHAVLSRVNESLSTIEKVRRFIVADEPLTIENHMLTPTMKVRRHKVRERYGKELEALYA